MSHNGTGKGFGFDAGSAALRAIYALAAFGLLLGVVSCGGGSTSSSPSPAVPPAPTITSFAPSSGNVGASVTVTGTHLTGTTTLSFNGTSATFTINGATQITATVPNGATTGKISLANPNGNVASASNFTVTVPPPAPTITSFTPASGPVATIVSVSGTNFTGATAVAFNSKAATSFTVNSATQITATVASATTTGKITVTTPGGTATSTNNFTVTTPSSGLDLNIDGLYVTQATQDYPNPIVPLVKDRSGWVRVFVKASQTNTVAPQVRVQFINGSTINTLTINAPSAAVPTSINPDTNASWNAAVASAWIQPGTQVTATVDPTNLISESDETNNQFSANLDVRTLKVWKETLIPVHTTDNLTASVTSASRTAADWVDFAKRLHPVPDAVDVIVSSTFNSSAPRTTPTGPTLTSDGTGWSTVLNEIRAKRTADGATDRYYYGVVKVGYSSGVAGLGYVGLPAAIGWDYNSGPSVLAHEVGHNFGRQHSPCGGAGGPDPNYPYAGGIIGVTGWDAFATTNNLKQAAAYTDVMGYCSTQWISDYVYMSVLNFRAASSLGFVAADTVGSGQEGLLVWGRIENNRVILEPAFRVPATGIPTEAGPYSWEARDALGRVLASVPFNADEVADLPNTTLHTFSFIVPLAADTMNSIHSLVLNKDGKELTRTLPSAQLFSTRALVRPQYLPNRRMQFSWDAVSYPMVMLKDARTGEVRGFLRGGTASVEDVPDDMEVHFSDGVHSQAVRYQKPAQ